MREFTVFCREANGEGTIYIDSAKAETAAEAARMVLEICAAEWSMELDHIAAIGIAEGNVSILAWDDESGSEMDELAEADPGVSGSADTAGDGLTDRSAPLAVVSASLTRAVALLELFDRAFGDAVEQEYEIGGSDAVDLICELSPSVREFLASAKAVPPVDAEVTPRIGLCYSQSGRGQVAGFRLALAGMNFHCDLVEDEQIRQAARLGKTYGVPLEVASSLQERVMAALQS